MLLGRITVLLVVDDGTPDRLINRMESAYDDLDIAGEIRRVVGDMLESRTAMDDVELIVDEG